MSVRYWFSMAARVTILARRDIRSDLVPDVEALPTTHAQRVSTRSGQL
jgi:hypothetical protein